MRNDTDYRDLPKEQIQAHARLVIMRNGGPEKVKVHFKYTCGHCGSRQTFTEPNTIYDSGQCSKCGKETRIQKYGYLVVVSGEVVNEVNA